MSDIFPDSSPANDPSFPSDDAWPSNPPRANFYAEASTLGYPLVSPAAARTWKKTPPIYIAVGGGERPIDSVRVVAQLAARQGVSIVWDEYELMPHNWPMFLTKYPQTEHCYKSWAKACLGFFQGNPVVTVGKVITFERLEIRDLDVENLTPLTPGTVNELMSARLQTLEPWTGRQAAKSRL